MYKKRLVLLGRSRRERWKCCLKLCVLNKVLRLSFNQCNAGYLMCNREKVCYWKIRTRVFLYLLWKRYNGGAASAKTLKSLTEDVMMRWLA